MTGLSPDLDQARRFLALIDEDAPAFCFQLATDDPAIKVSYPIGADGKRKDPLARIINLPPDHLEALARRNKNGAAVWVMINAGDGKGRKVTNVSRARGVFCDLDGSPFEPVMACELEPHCVVESSPGKFHAYWLVDGLPLGQFEGVQRRIAAMFDGDSISDLCRVMRLPGTLHAKDPAKRFLVRIVHQAERLPYPAAEILRVFPPLQDDKPKATDNGRADLPDPLAPDRLEELKAAHPLLFDVRRYKSTSERDFALASLACKLGWPDEDAVALIRAVQDGAKGDRADYCWRTVLAAYAKAGGAAAPATDRLERLVEQATADPGAAFEESSIDFLAEVRARDPAAYERARARLKKAHVRVGVLDQEVERRKPDPGDSAKGKLLDLPEPEPWGGPVEGAELIADTIAQIQRFVILSDHAAVAVALWTIHTHAHDAAFISPRLTALSPTKRCGKSSLFRSLARMARRPLPTSNISPAAMFRVIEAASPTLFCDEMSSIGDKERALELRGVVNSSHCRADAQVIRNVPVADGYEPRAFSTWAPMALAYVKHVDDQIRDRSVIIPMQRKAPGQTVAQLRLDQDQGFGELARKAARWTSDNLEALRRADPDVPRELNDRAADNWRPLLAIADRSGGNWHDRARAAAIALSLDADDEDTIGVDLLRDLWAVFDALSANRLLSSTMVAKLAEMEGRPWAEFGRTGKPITTHQLARLLKPFKVSPGSVRPDVPGDGTKGYKRESFLDLWERYFQVGTTAQARETATFRDFQTGTSESDVPTWNRPKPKETAACADVPVVNHPPDEQSLELTLEDLDRMTGERAATLPACARCGETVEPGVAGTTTTSSGEYLHNRCVEQWAKS